MRLRRFHLNRRASVSVASRNREVLQCCSSPSQARRSRRSSSTSATMESIGREPAEPFETSAQISVKIACIYQGAALSKDVHLFAPSAADQHAHSHGKP